MLVKLEQVKEDNVERAPAWLISFADVSALMLAFFVMLFSMSVIKVDDYEAIIAKIKIIDEAMPKQEENELSEEKIDIVPVTPALNPEYLLGVISSQISAAQLSDKIFASHRNSLVILSLLDEIKEEAVLSITDDMDVDPDSLVSVLSGMLQQIENQISVEILFNQNNVQASERSQWQEMALIAIAFTENIKKHGYNRNIDILASINASSSDTNSLGNISSNQEDMPFSLNIIIHPEKSGE